MRHSSPSPAFRALFLSSIFLLASACSAVQRAADTVPGPAAYGLAGPVAERVIDWAEFVTAPDLVDATAVLEERDNPSVFEADVIIGGASAQRMYRVSQAHDAAMAAIGEEALGSFAWRVWGRSSRLLRELVMDLPEGDLGGVVGDEGGSL